MKLMKIIVNLVSLRLLTNTETNADQMIIE